MFLQYKESFDFRETLFSAVKNTDMRCTFSNCLFLNFLKLFTLFATASIARKKLGQVPPPPPMIYYGKNMGGATNAQRSDNLDKT